MDEFYKYIDDNGLWYNIDDKTKFYYDIEIYNFYYKFYYRYYKKGLTKNGTKFR